MKDIVERLRAGEKDPTRFSRLAWAGIANSALAEIERLRAEVERLTDVERRLNGRLNGLEHERDQASADCAAALSHSTLLSDQLKVAREENERLRAELADHEFGFNLRWKADMRAIKRWQSAGDGRELKWPDHADLCVWLLDQWVDSETKLALADALNETLSAQVRDLTEAQHALSEAREALKPENERRD